MLFEQNCFVEYIKLIYNNILIEWNKFLLFRPNSFARVNQSFWSNGIDNFTKYFVDDT